MNLTINKNKIPPHLLKFFRPIAHKPKDLVNIPHMVAEALREDGWWLRSAAPWVKRASMPESVCDRPSSSVEYVFLLAKRPDYYYDIDAVRVNYAMSSWTAKADAEGLTARGQMGMRSGSKGAARANGAADGSTYGQSSMVNAYGNGGRNRRNGDWWFESMGMVSADDEIIGFDVGTGNYPGAHFATFSPKLVEPCILAGTSERGVCPACSGPWVRVVEREADNRKPYATMNVGKKYDNGRQVHKVLSEDGSGGALSQYRSTTTGWRPSCSCYGVPPLPPYPDDEFPDEAEVERIYRRRLELLELYRPLPKVPALVLDPFNGSGTTGAVALFHGRSYVGMDLNSDYLAMAERRIVEALRPTSKMDQKPFVHAPGQAVLFE